MAQPRVTTFLTDYPVAEAFEYTDQTICGHAAR